MNLPLIDGAVLVGRLAQIAQFKGAYDSKTDQTAQSDQRVENAAEFDARPGRKLPNCHLKLTSGTVQQLLGAPIDCAHPRRSDGAPQP